VIVAVRSFCSCIVWWVEVGWVVCLVIRRVGVLVCCFCCGRLVVGLLL